MQIRLSRIKQADTEAAFALYKASLYAYIDKAFGWDEQAQRERFGQYRPENLCWILAAKGQRAGLLCLREAPDEWHLHLLLLYPDFQGQGIGSKLMDQIQRRAARSGKSVTLSSFRDNHAALAFYQRLGYEMTGAEAHFIDFRLGPEELQQALELEAGAEIRCPYCGEVLNLFIDWSIGDQAYVEDCHVCCRPILVSVEADDSGHRAVSARPENE